MSFFLDIRVGMIKRVSEHHNADKLYVIEVDIGNERRRLVAGLKRYYRAEELLNKKVLVLCNLKPARIRGVESQGMLLAADDGKNVAILTTNAPLGTRVWPENEEMPTRFEEISIDEFLKLDLRIRDGQAFWGNKRLMAESMPVTPDGKVEENARIR